MNLIHRSGIIIVVGAFAGLLTISGCDTSTEAEQVRGFRVGEIEELFTITTGYVYDTDLTSDAGTFACYFYENEDEEPYYQIRLYDVSGEREIIVHRDYVLEHGKPRFSPDDGMVAYTEFYDWSERHIRLYDRASGEDDYLTDGLEAAWSPTGELLAVSRDDGLHLVELTGGEVFLSDIVPTNLEWSPDGAYVYGFLDGQVSRVAVSDGSVKRISAFELEPVELDFEILPAGDFIFCWLPGGYPEGFAALLTVADGTTTWLDDQFDDLSIAYPALAGDEDGGTLIFQRLGNEDEVIYYRAEVDFSFPEE